MKKEHDKLETFTIGNKSRLLGMKRRKALVTLKKMRGERKKADQSVISRVARHVSRYVLNFSLFETEMKEPCFILSQFYHPELFCSVIDKI